MNVENIVYSKVDDPKIGLPEELPTLPKELYRERLKRVRKKMNEDDIDKLVIYADREHFANFDYIVGFDPRFEEAILVIGKEDPSYIFLGRECYNMYKLSQIPVEPVLYTALSIPNNMRTYERLEDLLQEIGINEQKKIGIVGWKLIEIEIGKYAKNMFDIPAFIVSALTSIVDENQLTNVTHWFMDPNEGIRLVNNADEIAYYEYGAAWASEGIRRVIKNLKPGIRETELANIFPTQGLPLSCHPMVSSGERTQLGLVSPSSKKIELGDTFNTNLGLQGGLTCRAGYVASSVNDLPSEVSDYIEKIVKPFYAAVVSWYETIGIGITGGEIYDTVQSIIPKEEFGWWLNPGHFISTEEYISSPIYENSTVTFKSGQIVQMDIIPAPKNPYYTTNVEDGMVIADENLRKEIKMKYPEVWGRMQTRRKYMIETLGINLKPEILPMSNIPGLLRPLLLNEEYGMKVRQ